MLRISLSAFCLTLAFILLGGAFYVYPKRNPEPQTNLTQADIYKLEYYFDTRNFEFKVVEKPAENIKNFVISNRGGESIEIDIVRYSADNMNVFFSSWIEKPLSETETQYTAGQECRYLLVTAHVNKFYPYSNINQRQTSNPDTTMWNALQGVDCKKTVPDSSNMHNMVI